MTKNRIPRNFARIVAIQHDNDASAGADGDVWHIYRTAGGRLLGYNTTKNVHYYIPASYLRLAQFWEFIQIDKMED